LLAGDFRKRSPAFAQPGKLLCFSPLSVSGPRRTVAGLTTTEHKRHPPRTRAPYAPGKEPFFASFFVGLDKKEGVRRGATRRFSPLIFDRLSTTRLPEDAVRKLTGILPASVRKIGNQKMFCPWCQKFPGFSRRN
jgi:hypothetical protein